MLKQSACRHKQAGLSLVEMMVAIVAGLIVIGAALAFTVSTVRAYGENIRSTRLSQELRTGMNLVVRELRRAGYDGAATSRALTINEPTLFRNLTTPGTGCIIYEYDRGGSLGDVATATEKRAIRYNGDTRTLQMLTSGAGTSCSSGEWTDMTDPRVVDMRGFAPQEYETPFCVVAPGRDTDGDGAEDKFDVTTGSVTAVSLCLKAALVSDGSIVRHLTDIVRIRADSLEYATDTTNTYSTEAAAEAACAAMPAAAVPPTPSQLNSSCDAL